MNYLSFGNLISHKGLKPDPDKIRAIMELKAPENRTQFVDILGLANYLQRFSSQLADVTGPMPALLKDKAEFLWDRPQADSLEKMKQTITKQPVLAYFDPSKSMKENPQKLTQLSSRSHPRHLVGKRTAQKTSP